MKKKNLFWLLLSLFALFSCSEENNELQVSDSEKRLKSTGDGVYDLLGYGYNTTKGYLDIYEHSEAQVIDVNKLIAEQPNYYYQSNINSNFSDLIAGSDALDWSEKINNKTDGSLTVKLFTASINSEITTSRKISSKYSYATFFMKICLKRMMLNHSVDVLKQYLAPGFIADLNTLSAGEIVKRYGTHVFTDIYVGGKLEVNYKSIANTSEKAKTVAAGAKFAVEKVFGLSSTTTTEESLIKANTNITFSYKTIGGDPGKTIIGEIKDFNSGTSLAVNYNNWSSTVSSSNAVIVDIGNESLIPLYMLVSDNVKAEQIRLASVQYLAAKDVILTEGTIRCGFNTRGSYDRAISLDYNGDGTKDLFLYSPGGRTVCLNEGLKDGTFNNVFISSYGLCTYDFSSAYDQVIAIDFNSDGKDDLMCYRPGGGYVHLLKSNGDGTFTAIYNSKGLGGYNFDTNTDRAIVLDYNGDRKKDLLFYRPGGKYVYLLKGNGSGSFTTVYTSNNGLAGYNFDKNIDKAISLDYNNDGYDDVLCYRPGSKTVFLQKSNGNGTFTTVIASFNGLAGYNFDTNTDKAISLDYNGDGYDDLMCYRPGSGYVHLLKSNGNGQFASIFQNSGIVGYDLSSTTDQIISFDYNNDNFSDIILYRPNAGYAFSASSDGLGKYILDYRQQ